MSSNIRFLELFVKEIGAKEFCERRKESPSRHTLPPKLRGLEWQRRSPPQNRKSSSVTDAKQLKNGSCS